MSDFQAALPQVIKWSVKDNEFDDKEKNPKSLSLFIPQESIAAFAQHLTAMAADNSKLKNGKVHVKVRITGISQFGLLGRYKTSEGVDIAISSEAPAPAESSCKVT